MSEPKVIANLSEPFLQAQNTLGEGCLWNSRDQVYHWVDIECAELHTVDPVTKYWSIDIYTDESPILTCIALRESEPGFIGTFEHTLVLLPEATKPTSTEPTRTKRKSLKTLSAPFESRVSKSDKKDAVFNDGAADPFGRFLFGTKAVGDSRAAELFSFDPKTGETVRLLDQIGVSNGIGFAEDGKTMYYIDSMENVLYAFDYDVSTGALSNRRPLILPTEANLHPPISTHITPTGKLPPYTPSPAVFARPPIAPAKYDGLCLDSNGDIWIGRWNDARVLQLTVNAERTEAKVVGEVRLASCTSPTIAVFGGKNMDQLFIVSATADLSGKGRQDKWPQSGDVFTVTIPGVKGLERLKYRG